MHAYRHLLPFLAGCALIVGCSDEPGDEVAVEAPPPPVHVETRQAIPLPTPTPKPVRPLVGLPPAPKLSAAGYQLILDHEVGGGMPYYNKALSRPTVPPGESGVTIGVGYDLRFNSASVFKSDWRELPSDHNARLARACGLTHAQSQAYVSKVRDILVEWGIAEKVFNDVTVTRFYQLAKRTFPGMEKLDPRAQAVLVSLTFNRGGSMGVLNKPSWDSRREMRELRDLVPSGNYRAMAAVIRKMKRLWEGKGMNGLLRRREDEAKLMEACGG